MAHPGRPAWPFRVAALLGIAALCVYALGYFGMSRPSPEQRTILENASQGVADLSREAPLAEAYWNANPDVARDPFFGRNGPMGLRGARAHYERHGRSEGRAWPSDTP